MVRVEKEKYLKRRHLILWPRGFQCSHGIKLNPEIFQVLPFIVCPFECSHRLKTTLLCGFALFNAHKYYLNCLNNFVSEFSSTLVTQLCDNVGCVR